MRYGHHSHVLTTHPAAAAQALEFQAQQRLWALEQDQMAAAAKSSLQDAAAAATAALSAKQRAAAEQWQTEDR